MMTFQVMNERSDAALVAESRGGNRDAFRLIVQRYQTLVCSIAYSATGNVSRSEDISQETFIAAWARLDSLHEPEKLRGWLCGILRNRLHRDRREEVREPVRRAVEMEYAPDAPAPEALPSEQAVSREEEAILWRSLESIPPLYREPLVLFYREHRSVGQVAEALELSEDVVKQRLSRGRKLLQEEVQALVENTLRRTAPGRAFSMGVVALLPAAGSVGAVAGAGLGAKGSVAAKSGLGAALLVSLAPFLGIAAGVAAHWLVIRDGTADPTLRRRQLGQVILAWIVYLGLVIVAERVMHGTVQYLGLGDRAHFATIAVFWWLVVALTLTVQIVLLRQLFARSEQCKLVEHDPVPAVQPMRSFTLAAVAAGSHLAMFSWLIALAWRCADPAGAAVATGIMGGLGVVAYVRARGRAGTDLGRMTGIHVGVMAVAILMFLNLRTTAWVAASRGISVADASQTLPIWIVPVLTAALVVWVALVVAVTRPGRNLP